MTRKIGYQPKRRKLFKEVYPGIQEGDDWNLEYNRGQNGGCYSKCKNTGTALH